MVKRVPPPPIHWGVSPGKAAQPKTARVPVRGVAIPPPTRYGSASGQLAQPKTAVPAMRGGAGFLPPPTRFPAAATAVVQQKQAPPRAGGRRTTGAVQRMDNSVPLPEGSSGGDPFNILSFTGTWTGKDPGKHTALLDKANVLGNESVVLIEKVMNRIQDDSVMENVRRLFFSDSNETVGEIGRVMNLVCMGLRAGGIEFQFGAIFAFSKYRSGKLCLNQSQFNRRYLIHEATHLFANTIDNYYLKGSLEPFMVKNPPSPETAIVNADSFAMFIELSA